MAGSALTALDTLVRSNPPWLGAWRQRLALKAAAATVTLLRRTEDESVLRDGWALRRPGEALGPAGAVHAAWHRLASRTVSLSLDELQTSAGHLGVPWPDTAGDLVAALAAERRSGAPAPAIAARIGAAVMAETAHAEPLAWWLADLALSARLGWSPAVPLLAGQMHARALRVGPSGQRGRPGGEGFERVVCLAAAQGAAEACRLAGEMAQRAERLAAVQPKLRTKGAGEVVALLLSEDAVPGTYASPTLTRWASRRLFERLEQLGAVRELTGRTSFRLYGL